MERTSKGHYIGGDTDLEEENKEVYKNSELRFVEVQEGLCNEVTQGVDQVCTQKFVNHYLNIQWFTPVLNIEYCNIVVDHSYLFEIKTLICMTMN